MNNPEDMSKGMKPNLPLWSYQLQQNSKLAVRTRKDLEVHLITRALKDDGFKQELLANPKAVVEQELGMKLLKGLEINVLEETEDTVYMVLPCNPYEGMSEEELQASLGMTYEDVAQWILEQQRNTLLDEESSVKLIVLAWKNEVFKQELLLNPILAIEKLLEQTIELNQKIKLVVEETNTLYLIIPQIVDDFDSLSLAELNLDMATALIIGSGCAVTSGFCQTNEGVSACPR